MMAVMGGIVALFGGYVLYTGRADMARRRRILDTPTSAIARAPESGWVEITGRIVAGPGGLVRSPFRDLDAVWCRVLVEEYRSNGKSGSWHAISDETDSRPFFIDDSSPLPALVRSSGARVVLDADQVVESGTFNDAPPELEEYLVERNQKSTGLLGFNRKLRVREEVLQPGDPIYALGMARYEPGPPVESGYRSGPSRRLVLSAGLEADDELILSNKSESEMLWKLAAQHRVGLAMTGVGVLLAALGLYFG